MKDAKIRVTVDIFSGRENPVLEFTGKKIQNVLERLAPTRKMERGELGIPPMPTLGYRGLVVEQVDRPIKELPHAFRVANGNAFGAEFAYEIADEAFEDFVCGSVPKELPIEDFRREIQRFKEIIDFLNKLRWRDCIVCPKEDVCKCAPIYEPEWWNVSARQPYNNCYNYATNYRTDTFAQPGRAAGAMYTGLTCDAVKAAAIRDELVDSPGADGKCPEEGHLVALVIWPGWDFHWYRKGPNGLWSHKPGSTAVTNLDNSANTISDPRTADRGGYTDFCTFMVAKHGHIKIN
jgi:hypothetical protein